MALPERKKERLTWVYPKEDEELKERIVREFNFHPVIAQILVSRGFESMDALNHFLYAKLPELHDPGLLAEIPQAVERIIQALDNKEQILVYGDNDVDGITGTTLLTELLQFLGAKVFYYISQPGKMRHDIVVEALEYAKKNECKLMITVDCGITAATEIAKVAEEHIDVIVTDHHEPTGTIPHCVATLNPKLLNNPYPNRDLTGVGVAFKLAHALTNELVRRGKIPPRKVDLKRYLDLVALGTVADMGALLGENRILVRYGIQQLRKTKRIGLAKLVKICDVNLREADTFTIVTKIAPRVNSLGRIAEPGKGVKFLLARHSVTAEKMARELDLNNAERQKIEKTVSLDVESTLSKDPDILKRKAIVLSSNQWHPGVIAIVCTRISKQYNRPTVMIAIDEGVGKGSLRSIPEFPLLDVLKGCSDLLTNFGGHDFAAGLTIPEKNIEKFKSYFTNVADKKLQDSDVINRLHIDSYVNFEDLTFDFMESLSLLEPHGNANPQPVLYTTCQQAWPPKVIGKAHLKLYLAQGERVLEGIAFGCASQSPALRKKNLTLEVAFTPQINPLQGSSIQLIVKDFKIVEEKETPSESETV